MKTARGICVRRRCWPIGSASKVSACALGKDPVDPKSCGDVSIGQPAKVRNTGTPYRRSLGPVVTVCPSLRSPDPRAPPTFSPDADGQGGEAHGRRPQILASRLALSEFGRVQVSAARQPLLSAGLGTSQNVATAGHSCSPNSPSLLGSRNDKKTTISRC